MELKIAAMVLKELGHTTRLDIYKTLVKAGRQGLPVGELQQHLAIPASTLSHHLSSLISVSLVRQERQGEHCSATPVMTTFAALIAFLTEECCADEYAPPGFMSPPEKK